MQNVHPRGKRGIFYVKKDIPSDVRHAFGGKAQIWKSLGTTNKHEAARFAANILSEIDREIAEARGKPEPSSSRPTGNRVGTRIDPEKALAAIDTWRHVSIQTAYEDYFNGLADQPASFSDADRAWSQLVFALQQGRTDDIADFDNRLALALQDAGLPVTAAHAAIPRLRPAFAAAWLDVETYVGQFRRNDFFGWLEEVDQATQSSTASVAAAGDTKRLAGMKLKDLLSKFAASEKPKDEAQLRGYVRRLEEYLGDPDISTIRAVQMDAFLVELRKFPNTKKPAANDLSFNEVITTLGAGEDVRHLSPKTVWKWFSAFKRLFAYALRLGLIERNPVAGAMPKLKPDDRGERLAYSNEDIAAIFAKPLFQGAVVRRDKDGRLFGYRHQPGSEIVRDVHYWLPIFCLLHGVRIEEVGAALVADIRRSDDVISYLDLTQRTLKTRQSRRQVPLHPCMIELGFHDYVQGLRDAGETYLFPDLPHDPTGALKSTRQFTKWWGYWCTENAGELGETGFNSPDKSFHSFRHSFKRACRDSGLSEEIHDQLTGHASQAVSRAYGQGASLRTLADAMAKVKFPTLPELAR